VCGVCLGPQVRAQERVSPDDPYSGDLWTRSTLTGDWGGARNELAAKGVTIDLSLTQVGQSVVDGGKDTGWQYGGRGDMTLTVDSQKLGLWPGGFLTVEAEGNFASEDDFLESVNGEVGALMPVNSNQLYPIPSGDNFNLPALNFAQFLSPYLGLTVGKYATITPTAGDMNEFAHGKGDTQFMNLALNVNPVILTTVPYSTLGTGAIVLPTKDPHQAIVNFLVVSSTGDSTTPGFDDLDGNNLSFLGEGRVRTGFFGRTGHQTLGVVFSNRRFTSIDQSARFIFENGAFETKKGSWNLHYNFDQYVYEPRRGSGEGVGVFGRFGASDGNPNFMEFFYSIGVGGTGMIPGRPRDRFGVGYYFIDVNNPKLTGLFRTTKLLRNEHGFEAFYNVAVTPWMQLTPNIQVVRGAQQEEITVDTQQVGSSNPFGVIASRKGIDTTTVLGIRFRLVF
jgi:porin